MVNLEMEVGKMAIKDMREMSWIDWLALMLLIIGGLNWGLVGFFNYNLVDAFFGIGSMISRIIYVLVGISALYFIFAAWVKPNQ